MPIGLGLDVGTEYCRLAVCHEQGLTQTVKSAQRPAEATPCLLSRGRTLSWGWAAMQSDGPWAWDLRHRVLHGPALLPGFDRPAAEVMDDFLTAVRRSHKQDAGLPAVMSVPFSANLEQRARLRKVALAANYYLLDLIERWRGPAGAASGNRRESPPSPGG